MCRIRSHWLLFAPRYNVIDDLSILSYTLASNPMERSERLTQCQTIFKAWLQPVRDPCLRADIGSRSEGQGWEGSRVSASHMAARGRKGRTIRFSELQQD